MIMKQNFLSQQKAAELLGVTSWSIDKYVQRNMLTRYKTKTGRNRYRRIDVERLAELKEAK
jgi:DNA-binding transcriptional MerR regulator